MTASIEERLVALAERTASIGPRPGFYARTLVALAEHAAQSLRREVVRSARLFIPVGLALAVVSVGLAARDDEVSSVDVAVAEQRWELEW
jgi:hypothetical protein